MARPHPPEACIVDTRQVLILLSPRRDDLADRFAGTVVADPAAGLPDLAGKAVYLSGDAARAADLDLAAAARVLVLRDDADEPAGADDPWPRVDPGRAPIRVHGLGVYYRRFFDPAEDFVARIRGEHTFQALTESTKPGTAHRTGIYLTPVHRQDDALHFHLLRCSTNLSGPTDDFRAADREIVDALNDEAALVFSGAAPLNHVLAQLYRNTPAEAAKKQSKARISSHADKTKDMPDHGVMAFCTFYEHLERLGPIAGDAYDRGHRTVTGLTRIRFRHKDPADRGALPEQFTITLYPDSVFFMPLSTNRRYTHEILPSELDAARLPTRLGYVVRCSKTEAAHADGQTYLVRDGARVAMEPPTPEGMAELRRLYAAENLSTGFIDYGEGFRFSMNAGDYQAPTTGASAEFRTIRVAVADDLFAALTADARLEALGEGRSAAVLVQPDAARGVPTVRTTTAYAQASRRFGPRHAALAREIEARAGLAVAFNNALLELYTREYATMGAHSDQALDLEEAGDIAVLSCYRDAAAPPSRQLLVESKRPGGPSFVVPLLHGHAVVFSDAANRRFRHRIVLDPAVGAGDNPWLGLTLRAAKTWVRFADGQARLADGAPLTLASEAQRHEFLRLRRRENQETDFVYPPLAYTLSPGDLLPPEP